MTTTKARTVREAPTEVEVAHPRCRVLRFATPLLDGGDPVHVSLSVVHDRTRFPESRGAFRVHLSTIATNPDGSIRAAEGVSEAWGFTSYRPSVPSRYSVARLDALVESTVDAILHGRPLGESPYERAATRRVLDQVPTTAA